MLKGASAPLRPCTSGSRCGVLRADWGLPAPLQNVSVGSTNARPRPLHPIDETDTLAAVPFGTPIGAREERPRAPTYTFQSLPIFPAHPIPTSEGHDGAAPSREGEHPCKAENSALVRLAHSRVALFHSISAPLLGALRCCLEIGENSLTASKPHSCTSFLNGFSSDPVCAVTPAPEVVFFQAGPLCLRLPMTITPTLGPLCDFSAYLLVYVPHRGFSHEGAPLDFRMPLCLGGRSVVCSDAVPVGTPTPGKIGAMHLRGLHLFMPRYVHQGRA
ncbi:hypothetical protein PAPYR_11173 [Paratrimastix pyriformis]|uniref:Uncharacterized protein n=1 Tax=Paratrimastix pyriformis TaxID=342808 RepID=A0ABQ8UA29_9EUKA|nr:hypothetical protein PAPYR_11173 [Paratrimastix pyriformis]